MEASGCGPGWILRCRRIRLGNALIENQVRRSRSSIGITKTPCSAHKTVVVIMAWKVCTCQLSEILFIENSECTSVLGINV